MERYSEYKDSGVKWLGEIPRHWEVIKTSRIFSYIGSGTTPKSGSEDYYTQNGIPFLQTGDLNDGYVTHTSKRITEKALRDTNLKIHPKGSLIVAMYGATIGKLGILDIDATVNQACCVLTKSPIIETKFAFYTYLAAKKDLIFQSKGGGQPNISQDTIRSERIPIPPIKEQEAIVAYLDATTSKIDEAIAQQQKMIDLLNERKQIIISNAVTKGLDPNVKMKPSGIDWIGDIPSHWELLQLKKVAKIILGKMLSREQGEVYPYLCAKDVHYGSVNVTDLKTMHFSDIEKQLYEVRKGDMLIVEGGAGAGGCAIYDDDEHGIYIQNSIMIVRCYKTMLNGYVCYMIQSINQKGYVEYICNKATIPHFTKEKVGSVIIPIPPKEEQKAILDYITKSIKPIEVSINNCQKQISLLQERKQIIINDVVTGKVKVV